MNPYETVFATKAHRAQCQDRVDVVSEANRTIVVVADGAGGMERGGLAAETVVQHVKLNYRDIHSADDWHEQLCRIDNHVEQGQSTVVVVDIGASGMFGASVGDSRAFQVTASHWHELTQSQHRKPLLGSGQATPVGFTSPPLTGLLIVATDGLFNYVKRDVLQSILSNSDFSQILQRCIEAAQLGPAHK